MLIVTRLSPKRQNPSATCQDMADFLGKLMVGERGFEPPAPWSQTRTDDFKLGHLSSWLPNKIVGILRGYDDLGLNVNPILYTSLSTSLCYNDNLNGKGTWGPDHWTRSFINAYSIIMPPVNSSNGNERGGHYSVSCLGCFRLRL